MPTHTKTARPASCFCIPLSLILCTLYIILCTSLRLCPLCGMLSRFVCPFPRILCGFILFILRHAMPAFSVHSPRILCGFALFIIPDIIRLFRCSFEPLPTFHSPALAKCALAKTFFCGWGPQKHEQGALCFLLSSIRHSSAIRIAKGVRLPSFLVLITLY